MSETDEEPTADAEREMVDTEKTMEHERERLEEDIKSARKDLDRMENVTGGEVAGDWRDMDDAAGGEDPEGAHDEARPEGDA
jgi:hypothetical protein